MIICSQTTSLGHNQCSGTTIRDHLPLSYQFAQCDQSLHACTCSMFDMFARERPVGSLLQVGTGIVQMVEMIQVIQMIQMMIQMMMVTMKIVQIVMMMMQRVMMVFV